MRLVKERILDQPVSALGHGQNDEPLAGFPDGRICRVDPVSLELTERFKLPSEPQWIGWVEARWGSPGRPWSSRVDRGRWKRRCDSPCSEVHDLATGKVYPVEERVSAFHVDRTGRLWLGGDQGLWLSEPGAKAVESLDPVPAIKGARIDALAADPAHADGVIAVLQDRGVFFLKAKAIP